MNHTNDIEAMLGILATFSPHLNRDTILKAKIVLMVAREGNCTSRYLQDALGVDQSTISRTTTFLSRGGGCRSPKTCKGGLGLIRQYRDEENAKRHRYMLTGLGGELIDRLVALMRNAAIKNLAPERTHPPQNRSVDFRSI